MNKLLEIKNLTVEFATENGSVRVVDRVSLSIDRGETVGLVGESGCGKSVTALSILRLLPVPAGRITDGEILFDGINLLTEPVEALRAIRGRRISMIFQEPMTALSPLHRIGHQLCETVRLHKNSSFRDAWKFGTEWLEKVGIENPSERMRAYPHELSGGMRQRVMIAMALMLDPELIIADEPTTALDVTLQAQIFDLITQMKKTDTSLLLITHDMGVIWEMCQRVAVMYAARIVEQGGLTQIFEQPTHPYTQGLLKAIPAFAERSGRLYVIKGQVPSPEDYPSGCRFADRCPMVFDRCRKEDPSLFEVGNGQSAACFLVKKESL